MKTIAQNLKVLNSLTEKIEKITCFLILLNIVLFVLDEVDQILSLCIGNVENQTKGVPDLCSDIYR